jgi:outer membrane protein OmpA-like peptidoglycan-associated protein
MSDYKLTNRGKFVLGLVILSFVIMIVYSGSYIINYFKGDRPQNHANAEGSTEQSVESVTTTEKSEETTDIETDTTETTDATETTVAPEAVSEAIYSLQDLEDLKQFKITITFEKNQSKVQLSDADLASVHAMMVKYPSEKLSIDGHVNGYPNYQTDKTSDVLSLERALYVEKALVELGIDKNLISVYNFGSEYPLYRDFGNQSKNDRVEIYFIDHFIKGSRGK